MFASMTALHIYESYIFDVDVLSHGQISEGIAASLPLFTKISIDGAVPIWSFLCKMHGSGAMMVFVEMKLPVPIPPGGDGVGVVAELSLDDDHSPVVLSFHMLFQRLVRELKVLRPTTDVAKISRCELSFYSVADAVEVDHFAVRMISVLQKCELELTCSVKPPAAVKPKYVLPFGLKLDASAHTPFICDFSMLCNNNDVK